MTAALRPVFSCVTENRPDWFQKVQNLVISIRELGGSLADASILVSFVEGVDDTYARWLSRFEVDLQVVDPVDRKNRYANKLRMLESHPGDHDVLVALDCDVVVVGDIAEFLSVKSLQAKPADCDMLTDGQWRKIFRAAGVPIPRRTFRTTAWGQLTYPYVNSGVLLVPSQLQPTLLTLWSRFLFHLHPVYESDADLALRRRYNDQISLACALAAGVPIRPLPVGINMPTHLTLHPGVHHQLSDIRIVHYHAGLDDRGFVIESGYAGADRRLDRFNRRRAEILRLPYDGLPRRSLPRRLKQSVSSRRWYHSTFVERLKEWRHRAGRALPPARARLSPEEGTQ